MSITIEESRLVDIAGQQKHRQRTGYDYSKQVQLEIQAIVESEIKIREISRSAPKGSLLPKPGVYNGTIVIRKADILAYSKSHPQIACAASRRKQIIEALKSGASATKLPKTKEQKRAENSKPELSASDEQVNVKVTDMNTGQFVEDYKFFSIQEYMSWVDRNKNRFESVTLCSDDKYDYEIFGVPSSSEQVSNPVNDSSAKDADLLISENAYYYPEISEYNTHSTNTKTLARSSLRPTDDSIIGELAANTEIKIIDCHIGPMASWAMAESETHPEYGRFYINHNDITILPGVKEFPKNLQEMHSIPDVSSVSIDWTTQPINTPYYDARTAKHKVVVLTGIKKLSKAQSELGTILAESFKKGTSLILSNYGKQSTSDIISGYEENDFYDNPARVVDLFVDDRQGAEIKALVEFPHKNLVRATGQTTTQLGYFYEDYDVSVFKDYISQVAKKIDSFKDLLDKFDGEIATFDPAKESENISLLPLTIDEIFKQNGIDADGIFSKKGFLTVSWDIDFKILSMKFEERGGNTIQATRGLSSSLGKSHMESQRTQNILYNLNRICAGALESTWSEFLQNYISYEEVRIIPHVSSSLPVLAERQGPPVKTLDQLQKEESYYLKPERKIKEAEKRENKVDFVGAAVLDPRKTQAIKDKVSGTTKDAYNLFLNNVDFRKIVFKTVKGLIPQAASSHLDSIRKEVDSIESDVKNYEKRIKTGLKDAVGKEISKNVAKIEETQQEITSGLDKFHKYQRQYENLEATLRELSERQTDTDYSTYGEDVLQTLETTATDVAEQLSESAEDALIRQISETTGLEPDTINGIKDKIPDLLGKKITFEEVTHFPKIIFRDDIPTDDISEAFVEGLKNASSAMVNSMIGSLIKNTLDALEKANSSSNRPNRLPDSDITLPEVSVSPESKKVAEDVFGAPIDKIENILDDATNLLSPEELCGLFDGKPNIETSQLMKKIMKSSYPELQITSTSQVSDFFNSLAAYTNFDSCRALVEAEIPDIFIDDFACPPNNSLRESILKEKGLTDEQIKRQLENERQRARNLAEDLLDQLKNGLLSDGYEAPSDFCKNKSSSSNSVPTGENSSSFMDENFRYSLRSTINKTFESVYTSFRGEGQEYAKSLFQEVQSDRVIKTSNDEEVTIKILERKPLAFFEQFMENPDIRLSQQFRQTTVTSPKQKLEIDDSSLPSDLRTSLAQLETETGSTRFVLLELPSSGNEITHQIGITSSRQGIVTAATSYHVTTPIAESSDSYEFSSKGFLEQLMVSAYKTNGIQSPTLEGIQEDVLAEHVVEIHNEVKEKVFRKIYKLMSNSPYFKNLSGKTEVPDFLLDYINLGPQVTPECDPHLLKVSDEVNEIFNKFKDDMCSDNVQTPEGVKPTKNALESSMMATCVRLTLRHYLIESLTRGLISMSTITGSANISDLILDYSLDQMKNSLNSYGGSYKEDFLEQAKQVYSGGELHSDRMMMDMMREEYNNISRFLYESLLLGDKTISFKNDFFNAIPMISLEEGFGLRSTVPVDVATTPFVIVFDEDQGTFSLCLALNADSPFSRLTGFTFQKVEFSNNKYGALVPIVVSDSLTSIYRNAEVQKLFNICFPLETYAAAVHIHEMESASKVDTISSAFGGTRDSLYAVFYTVLPQADDWKKENKMLSDIAASMGLTGGAGLTALWDLNFGVFDTPVTPNTFNFGLPLGWGKSFKGLFFSFAAKAVKDAALKMFKDSVEKSDMNISLASKISKGMKLAGINISTTEVSILIGVFPFPNPYMLTPAAIIYNALGLGSFEKSGVLAGETEESNQIRNKIEQAGLKAPKYCRDMLLD